MGKFKHGKIKPVKIRGEVVKEQHSNDKPCHHLSNTKNKNQTPPPQNTTHNTYEKVCC